MTVRTRPWPTWPVGGPAEREQLAQVLDERRWNGVDAPAVVRFEQEWRSFLGVESALTCSNGSVSLEIALRALGIGSGDEVIVPAYTFIATATSVLAVNALPIFVDIVPNTHCIDPDAIIPAVTERTRAVIAVHLGGHPADLDRLGDVCEKQGLALIEDAAQAHGATWKGRKVGGFGAFGSWSFQGSKNLTAGEGGALTTNDPGLSELADSLRNCGRGGVSGGWYEHVRFGVNHRLGAFQAALLSAGLRRLPTEMQRREEAAAVLDRELARIEGIEPLVTDPRVDVHAHHLYQFHYDGAPFGKLPVADFAAALRQEGIPASVGYSRPLYQQPVFERQLFDLRATGWDRRRTATRYEGVSLPACEQLCGRTVWLPQWLLLAGAEEMADVVDAIAVVQTRARS